MDLFSHISSSHLVPASAPLAERMRPQTLSEFLGQSHLLGPGKFLSRFLSPQEETIKPSHQKMQPFPCCIFWGNPGTGKTTLAQLLAKTWQARFISLSAVQSGVKELRKEIEDAQTYLRHYQQRTVLFIDEIHRFHKGQQDVLLPHIETGTITLLGATTENPSFELNAALLSRCRVLRLEPLTDEDLQVLIHRALTDQERGLGGLKLQIEEQALAQLLKQCHGDGRKALIALEAAAYLVDTHQQPNIITQEVMAQALQQQVLLYDKAGDEHYNIISAFIKSMRGSDPDASVYWMARMIEAGEDPMFIIRRMVIFAAEDIGCADPQALILAHATKEAVHFIGLPEGVLPMSQLALYLSTAPKSNSALTTYQKALAAVHEQGSLPVPIHLRDSHSSAGRSLGYGTGYQYPHHFQGNHVHQSYLPERLLGESFYHPSDSGNEQQIQNRLHLWRK